MKTAEQIADEIALPRVISSGNTLKQLMVEAIRLDRAQQYGKSELKAIIGQLNDNATDNPEYLRGQVEMAMDIVGYECGEDETLRDEFTQAANK